MTRVLSLLSACFNPEETIVRACLSVDTQKLPRDPFIEHLILDGNWSDGTVERVAAHELRRGRRGVGPTVERRVFTKPTTASTMR